jgi:DNA-binding CsgD family transcriptional regulator
MHGAVTYTVLTRKAIILWAVMVVVVGIGLAIWLVAAYGGTDANTTLNAIRTAGAIVAGSGGAAALLLAARRQRATEIALKHAEIGLQQKDRDQEHQRRVTVATEADAEARRITALYTAAAEHLGSDKAPVRLAGLYALERLAQDNPSQRQTIVNVLCAYLRMPFVVPDEPPPADAEAGLLADHTERVQEREVRVTAQRLLRDHLRSGDSTNEPVAAFWPNIDLDLTGATLVDFDLDHCRVRAVAMQNVQFTGSTSFHETRFAGTASFRESRFADHASFENARFADRASFVDAQFLNDDTTFRGTRFANAIPDEVMPFYSSNADDCDDRKSTPMVRAPVPASSVNTSVATELSVRDRELLVLLSSGSTDLEIAASIGVSVQTVRRLLGGLMHRLGARSRFVAGVEAANRGWLDRP